MLRHIPFDRVFEEKINKTILDFIWENKKRYISKDIIFEKTKHGGMGALAVGKIWIKVLIAWFDRAIDESNKTPVLELAKGIYKNEYGHEASKLFVHGIMTEKAEQALKDAGMSYQEVQAVAASYCYGDPTSGECITSQGPCYHFPSPRYLSLYPPPPPTLFPTRYLHPFMQLQSTLSMQPTRSKGSVW